MCFGQLHQTWYHSQFSAKAKSITFLTESTGGELEQKGSDSIQAYRYALMTRDKIVSIEDIKAYCQMVMKDELKSIKVNRGTIISDKPKEGFVKTIDVSIIAQNYAFTEKVIGTAKQPF